MTTYNVKVYAGTLEFDFLGVEGSKARSQIISREDVHAVFSENGQPASEIIIPFHAIEKAEITAVTSEDPTVVDAVCNETNSEDSGEDSGGGDNP